MYPEEQDALYQHVKSIFPETGVPVRHRRFDSLVLVRFLPIHLDHLPGLQLSPSSKTVPCVGVPIYS
jgi:hypothetical protein